MPVAVVVLEPLRRLGGAPRIDVSVGEIRPRCPFEQHEHADPGDRLLLRAHVDDLQPFLLHLHPVVRPRVGDPDVAGPEELPKVGLGRPDLPDEVLLGDEQLL